MPALARLFLVALCATIIACSSTLAEAAKPPPWLNKKNEEDTKNEFRKLRQYSKSITKDINKKITTFLASTNIPVIDSLSERLNGWVQRGNGGKIGYGFAMGYSSGFALKKVSNVVSFTVGGLFIVLQVLSYNGYVKVNYDKINDKFDDLLDLNHDGTVDAKDAEIATRKIQSVLSYNMPTGGGFMAGFLTGFK